MTINRTQPMLLTDFLAQAGFGGRREGARLIAAGRVQVSGAVVTKADLKIVPASSHVRVDGKLIKKLWPPTYILMHKPPKTMCTTFDPRGRKTVYELLGKYAKVVQSVGRLDYDTEGALLFTNDGELAHALASPDSKAPKVYRARVKGKINADALDRLRHGVDIGGYVTAPARVMVFEVGPANTWLRLTLTEGKNRQVRRMGEAVGHRVLRLIREEFGPLCLDELAPGKWRHLDDREVRQLREMIAK